MYIDPDKELAGYRQIEIRDFLRKAMDCEPLGWNFSLIERSLNVSRDEAVKIFKELESTGLIQPSGSRPPIFRRNHRKSQREELIIWDLTDHGRRFAKASTQCISRDHAEETLRRFPKRVEQANNNADFTYTINRALLFGSCLEDRQLVGDVDIALEFKPKSPDPRRQKEMNEARIRKAEANGKCFDCVRKQQDWPQEEIREFLKEGSCHIDFDIVAFVEGKDLRSESLYPTPD